MIKEPILLGIAGIVLGIGIIVKTNNFLLALIPIGVGIALIACRKGEDEVEKRKDRK